jgi:glycosyltransferase 2 family protein
MHKKKILSSIVLFFIGITLFWFVYRNFNFSELKNVVQDIRFEWIIVSIGFGLLSHSIRALRWKMLINTMGYNPGTLNLFLSVIILYFTNLLFPRGGEVSRCAVISKYEKVPFMKLVGTVFIERITDLFAFLLILLILVILQFSFFKTVLSYPGLQMDFSSLHLKLIPVLLIIILITILGFAMVKFKIFNRIYLKLKRVRGEFSEGISVILHMKKRIKYIVYTFVIFLLWLLMLYAVFFAYSPTAKLSFIVAILTYTSGTLAYLLPIQAGIGTWHFIVINCLFFYGIDKESGMIFALIAHTFTNFIYLIFGPVAMAFLPVINNKDAEYQINKQGME